MNTDLHYMRHALVIARRGLGRVGNFRPSVGCVLVKGGRVVAAARTGDNGAPHAEQAALANAGDTAKDATAYVTLEPCAHEGNTPSCAQELVKSGLKRVVIACQDPDNRTNGAGVKILENAGIKVEIGVCAREALEINRGFFLTITQNRPMVTLKSAMTLDGKIALGNGESQWITGELARRYTHLERAQHEAILVGAGTAKADQPKLTTRLPGLEHQSLRVILSDKVYVGEKEEALDVDPKDLKAVLLALKDKGITRLLVEGGAKVAASFIEQNFVDRLLVFRAPSMIGADGLSGIADLEIQDMNALKHFKRQKIRMLGQDLLEIYTPKG